MSLTVKMIRRLVEEGGLRGFHFCTLNLERSVQSVLETLGWSPGHAKMHNRLIAVSPHDNVHESKIHNSIRSPSDQLNNLQLLIPT
jgi:methylenetetrahydrofolate reductase (NADPH)